jgi:hypothetical protein
MEVILCWATWVILHLPMDGSGQHFGSRFGYFPVLHRVRLRFAGLDNRKFWLNYQPKGGFLLMGVTLQPAMTELF